MAMRMSEEEYADLEAKMASDKAEQEARENQNKPPEAQTPPQEAPGPLKKSFLSRAREFVAVAKEDITGKTQKERDLITETKKIEREAKAEKARDEAIEKAKEPSKKKSGSGKSKKERRMDELLGLDDDDEDDEYGSRSKRRGSKGSPVGTYESAYQHNKPVPYESAYAGKNVMGGHFQEAYTGKGMANGVYKSPGNPKTYDMSRGEPQQQAPPRPPLPPTPTPQKARAPMPMPTIGSFGNGNIKMPTISLGGAPRIAGAHKIGPGNMPSINIPTLGGSTLLPGMGKNSKMGAGTFNIPKIGNWGKAPLKTELNLPNIGNLTIMGAGKKGGISFGLGEIPRLSLGAPQKRKK